MLEPGSNRREIRSSRLGRKSFGAADFILGEVRDLCDLFDYFDVEIQI